MSKRQEDRHRDAAGFETRVLDLPVIRDVVWRDDLRSDRLNLVVEDGTVIRAAVFDSPRRISASRCGCKTRDRAIGALSSHLSGDRGVRPTLTMRSWNVADSMVRLRPFQEGDLELLARFAAEPSFSLPYEWAGYRSREALRRRWEEDGFLGKDPHQLVVADAQGTAVGWVMWRDPNTFGRPGWAWEIGIMLAPESRGQGAGTAAQRLLVEYLFDTTLVHRLCALTEVDNVAERRALEKCRFRREGVLRRAGFRGGEWRDVAIYALLRDDVGADRGV